MQPLLEAAVTLRRLQTSCRAATAARRPTHWRGAQPDQLAMAAIEADLLLLGGTVVDGTGSPPQRADVLVAGGKIVAVGLVHSAAGGHLLGEAQLVVREVVDVSGMVVAPGFVDVHTHDDKALLSTPDMTCKVSQGVTTVVTGNCELPHSRCDVDLYLLQGPVLECSPT